jgi:glutamate/tyrosine decarboxylase-like PLP-dependent enzyme
MPSRRRFLSMAGLGFAATAASCQLPAAFAWRSRGDHKHPWSDSQKNHLLGYPINMNDPHEEFFQWREELFRSGVDAFAFNNVGNPWHESPIPFNTHDLERETITHFGGVFRFPIDDIWGFVSHSGTDSNMHGMYMGRTLLKGRTGQLPKCYFTQEAHYSVQILRDLLGLETVMVRTRADGGMDPNALAEELSKNRGLPALVVATVGTTFKGAIDDVDDIREVLAGHPSYLHVDAALFGGYLPFTRHAAEVAHDATSAAPAGRYDSIAVSCHKFFGFPSPAGLFVTRRSLYEKFNTLFSGIHNPEYIHHVPGTITCSRDAVKPAEFHYFTTPAAEQRQRADAQLMMDNTTWFHEQLQTHFPQLQATRSNRLSNTIYFRHPGDTVVKKYSLATMQLPADKGPAAFAHVVIMPHVTNDVLTEFLDDLTVSASVGKRS